MDVTFLLWVIISTLPLSSCMSPNQDGHIDQEEDDREIGECLPESICRNSGGVRGNDRQNYACLNSTQTKNMTDDHLVYCTTYKDLAMDLCRCWLPHSDDNGDKCEVPSIESRIMGGTHATQGEIKHIAAVGKWNQYSRSPIYECAGSLLSTHFVLTAAHCTSDIASEMYVRLGEHNFRQQSSEITETLRIFLPTYHHRSLEYNQDNQTLTNMTISEQTLEIIRVIKHPMFDGRMPIYHDLALLELKTPVLLNNFILPICLPYTFEEENLINRNLTVAGWGRTKYNGPTSDILKKVTVPVVGQEICQEIYTNTTRGKRKPIQITTEQICAGIKGRDACQGDSGGPLFQEGIEPDYPCGNTLLGVVSFGRNCGKIPGIYMRVSHYIDWIMRYIAPTHYYQQVTEQIYSSGLEFDGKSFIKFGLNNTIFTHGFKFDILFKTNDHNGSIINIKREGSFLTLGLLNGKIRFREYLGGVVFETINQYNDGLWYNITVQCSRNTSFCQLKIGSEHYGKSWDLPTSLEVNTTDTLVIGGDGEQFYRGCLIYSASSSLKLKMAHDAIGTATLCYSNLPVNGNWGSWNSWTECSSTCGTGQRHRIRFCDSPAPVAGGEICPGTGIEVTACENDPCQINDSWEKWGSWRSCTVTCGRGVQQRKRLGSCIGDGRFCGQSETEQKICVLDKCPRTRERVSISISNPKVKKPSSGNQGKSTKIENEFKKQMRSIFKLGCKPTKTRVPVRSLLNVTSVLLDYAHVYPEIVVIKKCNENASFCGLAQDELGIDSRVCVAEKDKIKRILIKYYSINTRGWKYERVKTREDKRCKCVSKEYNW